MKGLIFRPATLQDKEKILAITDEEFFDLDGLRSRFDDHFNNPYRFHFLAELNGNVISFTGLKLVDSGRSLYSYGARTMAEHTGQGVQTELVQYAVRTVVAQYPTVQRVLQETWNPTYTQQYFNNNDRKKLLVYQNTFVLTLNTKLCARLLQEEEETWIQKLQPPLQVLAPDEVSQYIEDIDYENKIMFVDYHFFEASKLNHEILCELVTRAYMDRDANGRVMGLSTLETMAKVKGTVRLRYDININAQNADQAIVHVIHHIKDIVSIPDIDDEIELFIRFCNKIDEAVMYNFLVNAKTEGAIRDGAVPKTYWKAKAMELKGLL